MRKISLIVLFGSLAVTVSSALLWVLGFIFAVETFGGLIHLLLLLSMVSSFGILIGAILLIISYTRK